jgi:hypothetical protein
MLDAASRSRLELICANEIAAFGYHWREPDDTGTVGDAR